MAIPVSSVVNVSIAIGALFPARFGFGTLNLITAETGVLSLSDRTREYNNLDAVGEDWGTSSEVYIAATTYFSQSPRPTSLKVSIRYETAQSAELRGGSISATLPELQAITDGEFAIDIDGAGSEDITGMDYSAATDFDDVATIIELALQAVATGGFTAATCSYDGSRFVIQSGTAGATSSISFATEVSPTIGTDVSSILQLRLGEATKINGINAETITASLDAIQNVDQDWYGFTFTKEVRDNVQVTGSDAVLDAAAWAEAQVKVFVNTTNDPDTDLNSIGYKLEALGYGRTMTTYSSYPNQYPSVSAAARAFTTNFSQADSTITLKFKQMPGITAEDLTQSQKAAFDAIRVNAYIVVGASDMFAESFMANGTFFDEVHGIDWLTNAIETNVFGYLLTRTTKVPYTDKGIAALEQQVISALDEAVRNGLIAPGTTADGEYLGTGYKVTTIPAALIDQSNVDARHYPGLSFVALGAGAIHSVQINGVFER